MSSPGLGRGTFEQEVLGPGCPLAAAPAESLNQVVPGSHLKCGLVGLYQVTSEDVVAHQRGRAGMGQPVLGARDGGKGERGARSLASAFGQNFHCGPLVPGGREWGRGGGSRTGKDPHSGASATKPHQSGGLASAWQGGRPSAVIKGQRGSLPQMMAGRGKGISLGLPLPLTSWAIRQP